jgi:hypothetical protein
MIDFKQSSQYVFSGGGAVYRRNDMYLHTRKPEEVEILFRRVGIVARDDEEAVVPKAASTPHQRAGLARDETHFG